MHYVFVDYENVQPKNLEPLVDIPCTIYVFIGALQPKLPVQLVTEMQKLGDRAKYVQISSSEKDALDFHIAYYIGEISANDKDGHFHILSNDKGFDPLVDHLRGRNIKAERVGIRVNKTALVNERNKSTKNKAKPPANPTKKANPIKSKSKLGTAEKVNKIKQSLRNSQPGTEEKLHNFIKNKLPCSKDEEIQNLINCLRNKKIVQGSKEALSYQKIAS